MGARTYTAIDVKSFYASVECVYRDLNPLKANLLVADESRSDQTICLAVSPNLKAKGVPGRPRLFEAKQAIERWEKQNRLKVSYLIALPHMAEYERIWVGKNELLYYRNLKTGEGCWSNSRLTDKMAYEFLPSKYGKVNL